MYDVTWRIHTDEAAEERAEVLADLAAADTLREAGLLDTTGCALTAQRIHAARRRRQQRDAMQAMIAEFSARRRARLLRQHQPVVPADDDCEGIPF